MSFTIGEKGGGLRRLLFLIGWGARSKNDARSKRNVIAGLISSIEIVKSDLEESITRLKKRHGHLVKQAISSMLRKENDRALIYANEAIQVRRVVKKLLVAEKVLEQVKLRLETIENISNLPGSMVEAVNLLMAAKDYVQGVMPSMAYSLENLISKARTVVAETTDAVDINAEAAIEYTPEAKKLLEDIERVAEETVKNQLPEIPLGLMTPGQGKGLEIRIKENAMKVKATPKVSVRKPRPDEIDRAVLEYILTHGGFVDISDLAVRLGVEKQDIMSSLHRLKEQNKITF